MTSTGLHDTGEEWAHKTMFRQDNIVSRDTTLELLLYDDTSDSLSDSDDIGSVTTEPSDGNYSRQNVNLDAADVTIEQASGDIRLNIDESFDVKNTTGTIDAAALVVELKSDVVNSEGSQNKHLLASVALGDQDLSQIETADVSIDLDLT